jgi:hypothetical protein
MKTKIFTSLLLFLAVCYTSLAQEAKIEWSEKIEINGTNLGFFDEFVGESEDLIFASFAHQTGYLGYTTQSKGKKFHYRLASYDKNTLREVNHVEVRPYRDQAHKGLWLVQTIVTKNHVIVFWRKNDEKSIEIFAEAFDLQLKPVQGLTSIIKKELANENNTTLNPIIIHNIQASSKIIVGIQYEEYSDLNSHLFFKTIDDNFGFSCESNLDLGVSMTSEFSKAMMVQSLGLPYESSVLNLKYYLLDENTLMISNFTTFDLTTGETNKYSIEQEGFVYTKTRIERTSNEFRIAGFYNDLNSSNNGNAIDGFFLAKIDTDQKQVSFTHHPFTEEFSEDVYKMASSENMSDHQKEKDASRKAAALNGLTIEQIEENQNGFVIFCSIEEKDLTTHWTNQNVVYTTEKSIKTNVYALALDHNLNFKWHSTITRKKTLGAWNLQDINVMPIENGYFVTYGDDTIESADGKGKSKSLKQRRDQVEYAFVFNDGQTVKKTLTINDKKTLTSNRKYISSTSGYTIYGSTLYVQSWNLHTNAIFYPLVILSFGTIAKTQSKFRKGHIEIGKLSVN